MHFPGIDLGVRHSALSGRERGAWRPLISFHSSVNLPELASWSSRHALTIRTLWRLIRVSGVSTSMAQIGVLADMLYTQQARRILIYEP